MSDGAWRNLPWWRCRAARLRYRIGRRGAALLVFAFVDVIIGWSLIDPSTQAQTAALPVYRATVEVAPLSVWGWTWIAVAAVCVAGAVARSDWFAFAAAIGIKLVWAGCFIASWLVFGAPRGWLGAATWGVVAALVYLISGWPEPLRLLHPVRGGKERT